MSALPKRCTTVTAPVRAPQARVRSARRISGLDGAENYRETARERLGLGCKQEPERVREAECPLADRYVREYVIDEMRRRLDHASSTAARAEAAALSGEGDQVLVAAAVALHTNEAVFQATARQIVLELALDEPGRRSFT